MAEEILYNYEHSSGPLVPVCVPWERLTDATPTLGNPCEVASAVEGTHLSGAIMSLDADAETAIVNIAPGAMYNWKVRNVRTYDQGAEATFGAINYGDPVYYDSSSTMPAGVYLSTSPLDEDGDPNDHFGFIATVTPEHAADYPKGDTDASTEDCQVSLCGAGS